MEERTGWRGQNESQIGGEEKWQTCWHCQDQQKACRMAQALAVNLNILGLPKRKEYPQCHRESSWQERRSPFCQKEKEQSRLSRVPDHEGGVSQDEPHLGKRGELQQEHGVERVDSMVKEGRFQGGKGGHTRRASLEEVEVSG